MGAKQSGEDIARDCSPAIEEGYLVARTTGTIACDDEFIGVKKNVQRKFGTILELKADNSVIIGYDEH